MIRRPLALSAVMFVCILAFFLLHDTTMLGRDPVKNNADGEKQIAGFVQDDTIQVYGQLADYDQKEQFGQITTELYLTDVHIQAPISANDKSPIQANTTWKKVTGAGQRILVYINKEETLSIGETILLSGRLVFFEPATNPGQFDAEKYYKNKDILFGIKKAEVKKSTGARANLRQYLKDFSDREQKRLTCYLSQAHASILKAMLFGNKKELDEETKQLYQDNGIAHILAISGLHISMLGMAVYRMLRRLPVPHAVSLAVSEVFLVFYGVMVGFSASAFRAIVMFTFLLATRLFKRSYDMLTAVAASALLQLLIHPGYLFDCGFQLSYAAILGMGILLPAFTKITEEISHSIIKKIVSLVLPSFSVSLATSPILIWHYHELSFFSILLNIVVIPLVGVLLAAAIVMLILDLVCMPLASLCAVLIRLILCFYEYSCRFLELFPIGQKNVAHPSWIRILLYCALLIAMTILVNKKRQGYQVLFALAAVCVLLFPAKAEFSVWMLDVGQGDSSVIFTEEGKCFVIDCGSLSQSSVGEKRLIPFLKYFGVGEVDAVFVTHADEDHMNGILELLELGKEENIRIRRLVIHEQSMEAEPDQWEELVRTAEAAKIPVCTIGQGEAFLTSSASLTCLYPMDGQSGLTGNASSLVLYLKTDDIRMLFMGDLETEGEKKIEETYQDMCFYEDTGKSILKAGHHGSAGSSGESFLAWWQPDAALISCGKNNSYGHPHEETLKRLEDAGCRIWITAQSGAVCIR